MSIAYPTALRAQSVAPYLCKMPTTQLPYHVKAGESLFREGDDNTSLFEIVDGVFRLNSVTRSGRSYVIGFGFPGDILGYSRDAYYISNCDAVSDAKVICHRAAVLHDCMADPDRRRALLDGALEQVESMQDHCMMLGRNSARDRVAALLSLFGDRMGRHLGRGLEYDLPISRGDIAEYLGLTTETVSRNLTELRKANLIAIENVHRIVLLRPQHLKAMAEGEA